MKIERTKNASRNIVFGVILKIYQTMIPFLMRTAMIYYMGVQYLGLSSLFVSILQVLNLAELGVGAAMVYSMYQPIAEDDTVAICALMKLYRTYYRLIGLVIGIGGIVLIPIMPKLIRGDFPTEINIYVLYLLNLAATVLSYWLFAYKNSLFQAHQRNDIVSKISFRTSTAQYMLQLIAIVLLKNFYIYIIVMLMTQILTNIVTATIADRMYPHYRAEGCLPKGMVSDINQRIRDLFTAKLGGTIVNSVDTIVISAFLGLAPLTVYQNYYFIWNAIYGMVLILFSAVTAGIGNSLMTESLDKNYNDMQKFTFMACWMITVCICCFAVLYQPFMKLWVGEKMMLDYSFVLLFCVYFFVMVLAMVWSTIKDAAGLWHSDRLRPLAGAVGNLVMNLAFVNFMGLYGILLSTIISYLFISMPWLIWNIMNQLYKKPMKEYLKKLLIYVSVCVVSCTVTIAICASIRLEGVYALIVYGGIAAVVPFILQTVFYMRMREFIESRQFILKMLRGGSMN